MSMKLLVANFNLTAGQRTIISYNFNLDTAISINELTIQTNNPFMFNFRQSGSSKWFATDLVRSDAIFFGVIPFRFPKPIELPARQGIEIDFYDFQSSGATGQIIFIGYEI